MLVEIIKDYYDEFNIRFPRVGEVYIAKNYMFYSEKIILIHQVDPITHEKLDKQYIDEEPICTEYRYNVRVIDTV